MKAAPVPEVVAEKLPVVQQPKKGSPKVQKNDVQVSERNSSLMVLLIPKTVLLNVP